MVALVVRSHGHEHLKPAAVHDLATGREEVVHAGGDGGQEQVVERDAEMVLGLAELEKRLVDGDGSAVEADRCVQ